MKLVEVSVRRPVGVFMFVIAIVALGLFSLRSLAVDLFPKIDLPIAVVATSYSGAAPEEVENLISRPLESSLGSIQGIDTISSQSQAGSSLIILMFSNGTNLDNALLDVRERIDQIKGMLPEDAGDPSVLRFDPQQLPVLSIGLSGHEAERLQQIAEDQIVPTLERQKGVASVSVQGGKTREILIELDKGKLAQYNISAMQIVQALRSENSSASVGSISKGDGELQVRVKGEFTSLNDLTNTLIHLPSGEQLKVGDVSAINDTFVKQTSMTMVNGEPSLVLSVQKQSDANTVQVADEVLEALEQLRSSLSDGTKLDVILDTALPIRQSIDSVISNMISGAVLAILILIVFLRSARSTLVIGLSIPIAVIATFMMMYFSGQTLNMITMGGLALGVGMMVDSSIVILENIFSYRDKGMSMKEAAIKGASELGPAVIASTITTVVVFLPMVFVKGLAADIFMPMAYAVSFSLIASLVVAITVVPMLSSTFIPMAKKDKVQKKYWTDRIGNRVLNAYKRILKWVLGHRKSTVGLTLALLLGSFSLVPFIGMEFFPASDQGQFQIQVETPSGTKLEQTKLVVDEVTKLFEPYEGIIDNASVTIGSSGFGTGGSNTATFTVQMVGKAERDLSTTDIVQALDKEAVHIPGAEITVSEIQTGLGAGSAIQISINGEDQETIQSIADQVIWSISSIEGVYNPTSSASNGNSELNILVDREKAASYGLTYQQIISEVQLSINGQTATRYREAGNEYDVKVILPENQRSDIAALTTLTIQTPSGQLMPLSAVAELKQLQGPAMIQRENQQRQVNVTSEVVGRDLGSVSSDVQAVLDKMNFPDGYTYSMGGTSQDMMESFADLGMALIFSVFLVYVVMAIQFESLLNPFIIMFSMPTMFIGILIGLFVTGKSLSMPALIGVILLAGIVVNNAIILVDYINTLRRRGLSRQEAILEGAPSRVRPIFMTTLTTVIGLIPLAMGIGEGAEMQAPLAIVVIFGLSFSTIFTLLLIPAMYTISEDVSDWVKRLFTRKSKQTLNSEEASF